MSSSDIAVSVRGLGKSYTIAHQAGEKHNTLAEAMLDRVRHPLRRSTKETFWALKDVDFDIKAGEVVGIVGRNGAGKSTLLKLLSQITEPTTGTIDLYGRVGSLLEVGTGFHGELTGRENVYLNGAILGMTKAEIRKQFDAIVDFAGVEQFLDTPVKRYSSGMYVRLAFAVAAHLKSEILIVDEVLAVGDGDFQKKCLGKMHDVSSSGRTVLFVSHNLAAVKSLCSKGIYLRHGALVGTDSIEKVLDDYLQGGGQLNSMHTVWKVEDDAEAHGIAFREALIQNGDGSVPAELRTTESFDIVIRYELTRPIRGLRVGFSLKANDGTLLCGSNDPGAWPDPSRGPGIFETRLSFPGSILNEGIYSVDIAADFAPYTKQAISAEDCLRISLVDVSGHGAMHERLPGILRPDLKWRVALL